MQAAKRALHGTLRGPCHTRFVQRFVVQTTCGRGDVEVCCRSKKRGKRIGAIVRAGTCAGRDACVSASRSVGSGCPDTGGCVTTTTTTTSTTTTTTSSNTTSTTTTTTSTTSTTLVCGNGALDADEECDPGPVGGAGVPCALGLCDVHCTCPPPPQSLEFTTSAPGGHCGSVRDGAGNEIKPLTCGGLNIGGGASAISEASVPDGSTSRFTLDCANLTCTIGPTSERPASNSAEPDCSAPGCNFGTPLPIPNAVVSALSVCVLNTWSAAASGTLDLATGAATTNVPLVSDVYLTGNADQPCPRCSASGRPDAPGTGTCDRGPRAGRPCTTVSSTGLTRDCPTGGADATHACSEGGNTPCIDGAHVGPIQVDLSPLTTTAVSRSSASGLFCPDQVNPGCLGEPGCRTIAEEGATRGPITPGRPTPATLASVFCIAATANGIVNSTSNLPGPGAVALPGAFVVE